MCVCVCTNVTEVGYLLGGIRLVMCDLHAYSMVTNMCDYKQTQLGRSS